MSAHRRALRALQCVVLAVVFAIVLLAATAFSGASAHAQAMTSQTSQSLQCSQRQQETSQDARQLRPTHSLPVSYDPAQNAVLHTPPTRVRITFNELLNTDISKLVVVNPSNQEVDNHDSTVSADGYTMTVTLPLLPAGTYVVFWRTHSAVDGHVASGSYLFHIARADGTVPPFTGPLPRGTFAGGAGAGAANGVDGPTLVGGVSRWIALLMITLLLGMIFWTVVVLPRQRVAQRVAQHAAQREAQEQSGETLTPAFVTESQRRMRMATGVAMWILLGATLVEIGAQAWLLDGSWRGVVSSSLLESILFTSRFGEAITLRLALIAIGLLALWFSRPPAQEHGQQSRELIFDPRVALIAFGVFVALAYEFSGHGGSAAVWWGPVVDFLHLIANGVWLGGLFTLALTLAPALRATSPAERRAYLASSIPTFSVPALIAVVFLVVTGPLNATVRLASVSQLWTTAYGIVLVIKSALFLVMVGISYYHAFLLRPLLVSSSGVDGVNGGDGRASLMTSASAIDSGEIAQRGKAGVKEALLRPALAWAEQRQRILQKVAARGLMPNAVRGSMQTAGQDTSAALSLAFPVSTSRRSATATDTVTERVPDETVDPGVQMEGDRARPAHDQHDQHGQRLTAGSHDMLDMLRMRAEEAILRWWRIEASLGAAVLLCAALMGPLAGTLEATPATTASFGASGGAQTLTQKVDGLTVMLNASPGTFGTNTFTVTIKNPDGKPASGASVFIVTTMVEMDMGANTINLSTTSTPGVYSGQGELSMAGHWRLRTVIRTREDPSHLHTVTFTISAAY